MCKKKKKSILNITITRIFKFFVFVLVITLGGSCETYFDSEAADVTIVENQKIESQFLVSTNPSDPLFLIYNGEEGGQIKIYGTRDDLGRPSEVHFISITNPEGDENQFFLDAFGRPEYIFGENGTQFKLEWLNEFEYALTVFANDGEGQINTLVNLLDDTNNNGISAKVATSKRSGNLSLKYMNTIQKSSPLENKSGTIANVAVSQCGESTNANVFVNIQSATIGNYNHTFGATSVGAGRYQIEVPNFTAEKISLQEVCSALDSKLGVLCDVTTGIGEIPGGIIFGAAICTQVATAALVLTPVASASVAVACESIAIATSLYCSTLGASPAPGAPSVLAAICKGDQLDYTFEEDLRITAFVPGLPSNIYSETFEGPQTGPFPEFTIDLGFNPVVKGLVLQPSAPAGQDYLAVIQTSCLLLGTTVSISVSGSDGFNDSAIYNVSESTPSSGRFEFTVPGADSGVQDICRVVVSLPDGNTIKRTASLVFR